MTQPFVAVHVGAGFHSDANSKELKSLCKKACKEAIKILKTGATSSEAAVLAISILENSSQTNAALGSNLGLSGTVECDASVMDGQGNFGAVGAVEGVVNPIQVAHTLLKESSQGCLPLGRVPPLVLVGTGAHMWAKQHHIATCPPDDLITDRARAVYVDHMTRLEGVTQNVVINGYISERTGDGLVSQGVGLGGEVTQEVPVSGTRKSGGSATSHEGVSRGVRKKTSRKDDVTTDDRRPLKKPRLSACASSDVCQSYVGVSGPSHLPPTVGSTSGPSSHSPVGALSSRAPLDTVGALSSRAPLDTVGALSSRAPLDTVGAICLDMKGGVAAGVSSGGISLKSPGRVGQAAMFGCGCWADNEVEGNSRAVACSTSGTGEYIIRTSLAKECAITVVDSSLSKALDKHFLKSKRLRQVEQKLAGAIALNLTADNVLHFSWGHTTESMCIGFMAGSHKDPTAVISKMENPAKSGFVSHVQALRIK